MYLELISLNCVKCLSTIVEMLSNMKSNLLMVKVLRREKKMLIFFFFFFKMCLKLKNFSGFFPGISINQSSEYPHEMEPVKPNRTLVLIYSCGAKLGDDGQLFDYVGNYVPHAFKMIGFEKCHSIKFEGVADPDKKNVDQSIARKTTDLAKNLNKNFS